MTAATALPEVLAPAGGPAQVEAALAAGADAIYLGFGELDARRGAEGFTLEQIPAVVERIHAGGARAHLTLNIQLGMRELGRAARTLAYAEQCGVDAVLVADPGLVLLAPCFPKLQFHFSTQAGISSAAGVRVAKRLGLPRVVLARELAIDEIAPCTAIGPEIEVFVQGALCFSVSGRCSLTSWVGGHSGNRGTCTSICRVNWSCNGADHARPMDMKDASAVRVVPRLAEIGVASFKIEGRLKTPQWVGEAVGLYRRALAGAAAPDELWREAERLGAYTGRDMTDAYMDGRRTGLIHPDEGRTAGTPAQDDQDPPKDLRIRVEAAGRGLRWSLTIGQRHEMFEIPRSQPHPGRDCGMEGIRERLDGKLPEDTTLAGIEDAVGGLRLPRRIANEVAATILQLVRERPQAIDRLKIVIPDSARALLTTTGHADNRHPLAVAPDQVRLDAEAVPAFAAAVPGVRIHTELRDPAAVDAAHAGAGNRLVCALAPVLYHGDLDAAAAVCARAAALGVLVEVNGWDGLGVALDAGCRFIAGPGMGILNPVAAEQLRRLGAEGVHALVEIDGTMLTDLAARCPLPLTVTVYGRPPLMTTRAWKAAPAWTMEDARKSVQIRTRREGPVVVLRPVAPFDWRMRGEKAWRTAHREMDLCLSDDPVAEWASRPDRRHAAFNLDRELV